MLARADEPLVHAQLPWERDGATAGVIYTEGVKPEGDDTFVLYAGGGDRVVEAFRVKVNVTPAQVRPWSLGAESVAACMVCSAASRSPST